MIGFLLAMIIKIRQAEPANFDRIKSDLNLFD